MLRRRHLTSEGVGEGVTTLATVARDSRVRVLRVSGRPRLMMRLATLGVVVVEVRRADPLQRPDDRLRL